VKNETPTKQVAGKQLQPTKESLRSSTAQAFELDEIEQLLNAQILRRPAPGIRQTPDDPEFAAWWQKECERRRRGVVRPSPARRAIIRDLFAINQEEIRRLQEQEFLAAIAASRKARIRR